MAENEGAKFPEVISVSLNLTAFTQGLTDALAKWNEFIGKLKAPDIPNIGAVDTSAITKGFEVMAEQINKLVGLIEKTLVAPITDASAVVEAAQGAFKGLGDSATRGFDEAGKSAEDLKKKIIDLKETTASSVIIPDTGVGTPAQGRLALADEATREDAIRSKRTESVLAAKHKEADGAKEIDDKARAAEIKATEAQQAKLDSLITAAQSQINAKAVTAQKELGLAKNKVTEETTKSQTLKEEGAVTTIIDAQQKIVIAAEAVASKRLQITKDTVAAQKQIEEEGRSANRLAQQGQILKAIPTFAANSKEIIGGVSQATNQASALNTQLVLAEKNFAAVATKGSAINRFFGSFTKNLAESAGTIVKFRIGWELTSAAINAALAPVKLIFDTIKDGFQFLIRLQDKITDIREVLLQNVTFSKDFATNFEIAGEAARVVALQQLDLAAKIGVGLDKFESVFESFSSTGGLKAVQTVGDSTEQTFSKANRSVALLITALNSVGVSTKDTRRAINEINLLLEGQVGTRNKIRIASGLTAEELNKQSLAAQREGKFAEFLEKLFAGQAQRIETANQRISTLLAQLDVAKQKIGAAFAAPVVEKLTKSLVGLLDFITKNGDAIKKFGADTELVLESMARAFITTGEALVTSLLLPLEALTIAFEKFFSAIQGTESHEVGFFRALAIGISVVLNAITVLAESVINQMGKVSNAAAIIAAKSGLTAGANEKALNKNANVEALLNKPPDQQIFFGKSGAFSRLKKEADDFAQAQKKDADALAEARQKDNAAFNENELAQFRGLLEVKKQLEKSFNEARIVQNKIVEKQEEIENSKTSAARRAQLQEDLKRLKEVGRIGPVSLTAEKQAELKDSKTSKDRRAELESESARLSKVIGLDADNLREKFSTDQLKKKTFIDSINEKLEKLKGNLLVQKEALDTFNPSERLKELNLQTEQLLEPGGVTKVNVPAFTTKQKEKGDTGDTSKPKFDNSLIQEQLRQFKQDSQEVKDLFADLRRQTAEDVAAGNISEQEGINKTIENFRDEITALNAIAKSFIKPEFFSDQFKAATAKADPKTLSAVFDDVRKVQLAEQEATQKGISAEQLRGIKLQQKLIADQTVFEKAEIVGRGKFKVEQIRQDESFELSSRVKTVEAEIVLNRQLRNDELEKNRQQLKEAGENEAKIQEAHQANVRINRQFREQEQLDEKRLNREKLIEARELQRLVVEQLGLERQVSEQRIRDEEIGFTTTQQRLNNQVELTKISKELAEAVLTQGQHELDVLSHGTDILAIEKQRLIVNGQIAAQQQAAFEAFAAQKTATQGIGTQLFSAITGIDQTKNLKAQFDQQQIEQKKAELATPGLSGVKVAALEKELEGLTTEFNRLNLEIHKTSLTKFAKSLEGIVNTVANGINSVIAGFQQGGVLGGVGAGLGFAGGLLKDAKSSVLQSLGAFGSIAGTVISFISGIFTAMAKKTADAIRKSVGKITDALDDGSIGLGEAIKEVQAQRTLAIQQLSGKKGRKELATLLPELDKEIKQLQRQQKDLQQSFENELRALRLGNDALADFSQTWDDINKKVKDFVGSLSPTNTDLSGLQKQLDAATENLTNAKAALASDETGNVNTGGFLEQLHLVDGLTQNVQSAQAEVTRLNGLYQDGLKALNAQSDAAEFLSRSIKKIKTDAMDQLAQGQQQAIDDALSLLDLYEQQRKAVEDLAKTLFDLANADSIERRHSGAVERGLQAAQAKADAQKQIDDINRQIALKTQIVAKERQVFNLASSRASLQAQSDALTLRNLDESIAKWQQLALIVANISQDANGVFSVNPDFISQINNGIADLSAVISTGVNTIADALPKTDIVNTPQFSAVTASLTDLSASISDTAVKLAGVGISVPQFTGVDAVNSQLTSLESSLSGSVKSVTSINTQFSDISKSLDQINAKFLKLATTTPAVSTAQLTIDHTDKFTTSLDFLEKAIERVSSNISDIKFLTPQVIETAGISASLGRLSKDFDDNAAELESVQKVLVSLLESLSRINQKATQLATTTVAPVTFDKTQVKVLEIALSELSNEITVVTSKISGVEILIPQFVAVPQVEISLLNLSRSAVNAAASFDAARVIFDKSTSSLPQPKALETATTVQDSTELQAIKDNLTKTVDTLTKLGVAIEGFISKANNAPIKSVNLSNTTEFSTNSLEKIVDTLAKVGVSLGDIADKFSKQSTAPIISGAVELTSSLKDLGVLIVKNTSQINELDRSFIGVSETLSTINGSLLKISTRAIDLGQLTGNLVPAVSNHTKSSVSVGDINVSVAVPPGQIVNGVQIANEISDQIKLRSRMGFGG